VVLRDFKVRPLKCCDGAAVIVRPGAGHAVAFPPVQLVDALGRNAPGLQMCADAERGDEGHAGTRQHLDGRVVQVIVVVVRDHDHVHRRHIAQGHRRRLKALGAEQRAGRGARTPHRVGQHAVAIDFQQHARMAQPGGAQTAWRRAQPGRAWVGYRQRCARHAASVGAPQQLAQRGHGRGRVAQAGRDGVQVAKAVAGPARRAAHALQPLAVGALTE